MTNNNFRLKTIAASIAMVLSSTSLLAEEDIAESDEEGKVEVIIVTARKVPENLQQTPIAISAFSPETLERRQINGTNDLGKVTPNLEFTNNAPLAGNNSSSQVFIRGIGQVDASAGVDPGVGLYIDDVYMGQSVGGSMELRDIERVQVLRGPQGTLFGRNTIGGAVLIATTQPGDELGGKLKFRTGTDNLQELFAAIDIPLSEDLTTRFSYGSKKQDGYVKRAFDGVDLGDTNNYVMTGKVLYTPSDALTIKFNIDYSEADENGAPLVFAASNESATFQRVASADAGCPGMEGGWNSVAAVPLIDDARCANDFWADGEYSNNGTAELESKLENWGTSLNVAYDVNDEFTFKSITAYRELKWSGRRDADNTPFIILHTTYNSDGEQFSQEFQFIYSDDKIKSVSGLYYFTEEYEDILTVDLNTPAPGFQQDSDNNKIDNDNWAVFSQLTYEFDDQLSGTLGVRHTSETKRSLPDQFNYADPDVKYLPAVWYEADFSATNISANLSYAASKNTMLYGSYSEGFKGGGFNSHFNSPQSDVALQTFHQFDEENAETWEIGLKSDLLDRTLRFNLALFTTDYTGLQFIYRVGVAPYLLNAGEASIDGMELELTWLPNDSWIIEAGIGILDDSIDSISTDFEALGASTAITTDNTLPYTPDFKANFGVGYTFEAGSWAIAPRIDVSHRSKTFFDTANTEEIAQTGGITSVDASVNIDSFQSSFGFKAGINNATNEIYPIAGNSSLSTGSGYAEIAYARERQYFISVSYEFN